MVKTDTQLSGYNCQTHFHMKPSSLLSWGFSSNNGFHKWSSTMLQIIFELTFDCKSLREMELKFWTLCPKEPNLDVTFWFEI